MLCLNTPTKSRNRLTQKKQDCPTVRLRRQSLNRMRFLNPKSLPTTDLNDVHTSWIQASWKSWPASFPLLSATLTWVPYSLPSSLHFFLSCFFPHYSAGLERMGSHTVQHMLLLLLSRFSRVRLCATPQTAAHQAPPSLGFSRQEHWSGLSFPSPMHESEK